MSTLTTPAGAATGTVRPAARRGYWRWILALTPFLLLAIWRGTGGLLLEADDAGQYLMHARALVEGRPYGDIDYIFSERARLVGPRVAPPGLPLLIAPVMAVTGDALLPIRALMLALAAAFLLAGGLYFVRHGDPRLGTGVALLGGLSVVLLDYSTQPLTDLPFAAAVWLALLLHDSPAPQTPRRALAIALLGGWAILLRPPGVALLPAILLSAMLRRRGERLWAAAPALLWLILGVAALALTDVRQSLLLRTGPAELLRWLEQSAWGIENATYYLTALVEAHLYPFPQDIANDVFHVATALLTLLGLAAWLRTHATRTAVAFAACYVLVLLVLPFHQARYLWPLYPFLVFGLLNGIVVLVRRFGRRAVRPRAAAVAFAFALAALASAAAIITPRATRLDEHAGLQQLAARLREMDRVTPLRVTFQKPRTLAWMTGIPVMPHLRQPPDVILAELRAKCITHVVLPAVDGGITRLTGGFATLVAGRPDLFAAEYRNDSYELFRLAPPAPGDGAAPDCR